MTGTVLARAQQHDGHPVKASNEHPLTIHAENYGVLGNDSGNAMPGSVAAEPGPKMAFVDPAGLNHITDKGPYGASGASGAIYKWLEINKNWEFPPQVRRWITKATEACYFEYPGQRHCIHVAGPDLRHSSIDESKAASLLTAAYRNVFAEFARSGLETLRLLPISGGIFSGEWGKRPSEFARLTVEAIYNGFEKLSHKAHRRVSQCEVVLCIFDGTELEAFTTALANEVTSRNELLAEDDPDADAIPRAAQPRTPTRSPLAKRHSKERVGTDKDRWCSLAQRGAKRERTPDSDDAWGPWKSGGEKARHAVVQAKPKWGPKRIRRDAAAGAAAAGPREDIKEVLDLQVKQSVYQWGATAAALRPAPRTEPDWKLRAGTRIRVNFEADREAMARLGFLHRAVDGSHRIAAIEDVDQEVADLLDLRCGDTATYATLATGETIYLANCTTGGLEDVSSRSVLVEFVRASQEEAYQARRRESMVPGAVAARSVGEERYMGQMGVGGHRIAARMVAAKLREKAQDARQDEQAVPGSRFAMVGIKRVRHQLAAAFVAQGQEMKRRASAVSRAEAAEQHPQRDAAQLADGPRQGNNTCGTGLRGGTSRPKPQAGPEQHPHRDAAQLAVGPGRGNNTDEAGLRGGTSRPKPRVGPEQLPPPPPPPAAQLADGKGHPKLQNLPLRPRGSVAKFTSATGDTRLRRALAKADEDADRRREGLPVDNPVKIREARRQARGRERAATLGRDRLKAMETGGTRRLTRGEAGDPPMVCFTIRSAEEKEEPDPPAVRIDCRTMSRRDWGKHDGRHVDNLTRIALDPALPELVRQLKEGLKQQAKEAWLAYSSGEAGSMPRLYVDVGCRSAKHRSVSFLHLMAACLSNQGFETHLIKDKSYPCSIKKCTECIGTIEDLGPWERLSNEIRARVQRIWLGATTIWPPVVEQPPATASGHEHRDDAGQLVEDDDLEAQYQRLGYEELPEPPQPMPVGAASNKNRLEKSRQRWRDARAGNLADGAPARETAVGAVQGGTIPAWHRGRKAR